MKNIVTVIRFLVGALFIFSGLVKANDPMGLSFKMQEFFELWSTELASSYFFLKSFLISLFDVLHHYSLALSVIMITLEIIAGIALIIGWKRNAVVNLLLGLIIFFTFLTGYAYLSGKFRNCGCFGDCIPITPFTSFVKDVLLLILISFLAFQKKYITPLLTNRLRSGVLIASLLFTILLQWYVLNYLPIADCLPYKEGNSITEQMKTPATAVADSFAIRFVYERGGKQFEFAPESLPGDLDTYSFVKRTDKLIRKGNAEPAIKGFTLTGLSGTDSTMEILNQPLCFLLLAEDFTRPASIWINDFKSLTEVAQKSNIPVFIVTASVSKAVPLMQHFGLQNVPVMSCDFTAIRTAARTNPTLYQLRKGVVVHKYSLREIDRAIRQ
ncbi:MAG: DoxX family protein [Flavisolibacter sp.]|nr:DoxX family protein [Flavisolibacter sp.]